MYPLVVSLLALAQPPTPPGGPQPLGPPAVTAPPVQPMLLGPSAVSLPPVPPVPLGPTFPPINLSHPAPPLLPPATAAGPIQAPGTAWDAAGMPCPGPAAHPFHRLPRICPLKPCDCDSTGSAPIAHYWVKDFHDAAHVPLPRFTIDGQAVCQDGLLIYEGMRVTVYRNGTYDVSFTAEVPHMPVTLRMQLVLQRPANDKDHPRSEYRLTLPPFRLEPRADARIGDPSANIFHVAHRGYSSVLAESEPVRVHSQWQVIRVGSARFGTPIAIADPDR